MFLALHWSDFQRMLEGHLFNQQLLCLSLLLSFYKCYLRYCIHCWFWLLLICRGLQKLDLPFSFVFSDPEVHFPICRHSLRSLFIFSGDPFSLTGFLPPRNLNSHLFSTDCQICMSSPNSFWAPGPWAYWGISVWMLKKHIKCHIFKHYSATFPEAPSLASQSLGRWLQNSRLAKTEASISQSSSLPISTHHMLLIPTITKCMFALFCITTAAIDATLIHHFLPRLLNRQTP